MSRKYCLNKKNSEELLILPCEWSNCYEIYYNMTLFMKHVKIHIGEVVTKRHTGEEETSDCLWRECEYHSTRPVDDIIRHVSFHVFHVKIKCRGANMITKAELQPCKMDRQCRSLIPDLPEQLMCGWTYCGIIENCPETFYRHVELHAANFTYIKGTPVKCEWEGCGASLPSKFKLKDHLRTHTQEKLVACPTCGALFSNKTKLLDHFNRQLDNLTECFQCSYCDKKFPAYRLLRDHLRHHVNQFKCPYCDMTCPNQSSVQHHIQYRHSNNRPYICEVCQKAFKGVADLKRHCETHNKDPVFDCHVDGCDFIAKTYSAMAKHYLKHQTAENPRYLCHVCDMVFKQGHTLTKHLKSKHNFKWPSGHKRFRYKLHEDGFSRLQLVRYESVVLTPTVDKTGLQQQTTINYKQEDAEKNLESTESAENQNRNLSYNLEMLGDVALSCNVKPASDNQQTEYQSMTLRTQIVTSSPSSSTNSSLAYSEIQSQISADQNFDNNNVQLCKRVRIFGNEITIPISSEQTMDNDYCVTPGYSNSGKFTTLEISDNRMKVFSTPDVASPTDGRTENTEKKSKKRKRKISFKKESPTATSVTDGASERVEFTDSDIALLHGNHATSMYANELPSLSNNNNYSEILAQMYLPTSTPSISDVALESSDPGTTVAQGEFTPRKSRRKALSPQKCVRLPDTINVSPVQNLMTKFNEFDHSSPDDLNIETVFHQSSPVKGKDFFTLGSLEFY